MRSMVLAVVGFVSACGDDVMRAPADALACLDSDADGTCAADDCNDEDANNWASCAACVDQDGDGYYAGCDAYTTIAPDCFDEVSVPASAGITLTAPAVTATMVSAGVRTTLTTALPDVSLATRICKRGTAERWSGTRMYPVGALGVQIGSFLWLTSATDYEVEVVATSASANERAVVHATVRTRDDTPPAVTGSTVYVSPGGNDTGAGTVGDPFATVARAVTALGPSVSTIELLPGVHRGGITLNVAGSPTAYKMLRAQPGAVIDGANATIQAGVTWAFDATNSTYSYGIDLAAIVPVRHVEMDGTRLYGYTTFTGLANATQAGVSGGFFYDDSAKVLHVRMPDSTSPATHTIHVPMGNVGVYVNRVGYWIIEGLEVRHFNGSGIVVRGGAGVWVRRNTVINSGSGIEVFQPYGLANEVPADVVIEDNTVLDTSIWEWGYFACKSQLCETTGIIVWCSPRHIIRRNTVEGTFNGIGPTGSGDEPVPNPDVPSCGADGDTYENTIMHVPDDGLELDGAGINQRIFRNRIEHRHVNSVSLSPLTHGPTFVLRNVSSGFSEAFIKLRSDNDVGWKVIAHNTAIADTAATGYNFWPPQCFDGLYVFNNVLVGQTHTLHAPKNITCSPSDAAFFKYVQFDGNLHDHRMAAAPLVYWGTTSYPTLQAFTTASGHEMNGVQAIPAFDVDGATPAANSAMLDEAIALPGINDRIALPDIGAVER